VKNNLKKTASKIYYAQAVISIGRYTLNQLKIFFRDLKNLPPVSQARV